MPNYGVHALRRNAMPLRAFRPRPLWPASPAFVKPVTGSWHSLSPMPLPFRIHLRQGDLTKPETFNLLDAQAGVPSLL
jgi:hypothetical protein